MTARTLDCRYCGACCICDLGDGTGFATVTTGDVARLHRDTVCGEVYLSMPTIVTDEFGKSCAAYKPGGRGCVSARLALGMP